MEPVFLLPPSKEAQTRRGLNLVTKLAAFFALFGLMGAILAVHVSALASQPPPDGGQQSGDTRFAGNQPYEASVPETSSTEAGVPAPPPPEVRQWIRDFRSPFLWRRNRAVHLLVNVGAPAVRPLLECLTDTDWRVRELAVVALGQIGDSQAVEPLTQMLADPAWRVRRSAAQALAGFRQPTTVEPLIRSLRQDEDWTVRQAAAEALGVIGDPKAVDALTAALQDKQQEVRVSAVVALGAIADVRVAEPLLACFDSENPELRRHAAAGLVRLGELAVGPAIERLRSEDESRRQLAAWLLVRIGPAAVAPLMACLGGTDLQQRKAAAAILAQIGEPAIEPLTKRLVHPEAAVRQLAAEVLEKIGWAPPAARQAAEFYLAKQDWGALLKLGDVALEPLLALAGDKDPFVRGKVAETLGKLADPRAVDTLITMCADGSQQVRWHAVSALA
ncbi:MAG: HEAT repeat domain-containing protein [Thermoguttaceae bacterium]|nr:HEAT repeat domain-containing protein [Thermoguttaceae bacterium]